MPIDPKAFKVVTAKVERNPSYVSSGCKSQITGVGCISAAGVTIPPMVIWDRKTLDLFNNLLCSHFLRYAPPIRPLLLLMDGHSSHYCPDTICYAEEQEVIVFTLPPNTRHSLWIEHVLKTAWRIN